MKFPRPRMGLPSPAMMVALVALCVAMGGTGFAASSLLVANGPATPSAAISSSAQHQPSAWAKKKQARRGPRGPKGDPGPPGVPGVPGPLGPSEYAEFYALMPSDNAATVGSGGAVDFPNNGPSKGAIARNGVSADTFKLPAVGTYRVAFSVSVTEPGQLELTLDSVAVPYTVSGRATGTSLISGESLITTTAANSIVSVVNPNVTALTITPTAGGAQPVAATLIVERLN